VIMGYAAGNALTTGASNTFNGVESGLSNTSGSENCFIGRQSGRANTTASYNSALGNSALISNQTGTYNSAFGYYSGYANTGSRNVFMGGVSGRYNTSGNNNTFTGHNSGRLNTTGSFNTALADSAGYTNTTGSGNVFIGRKAINANATDAYKLVIQSDNGNTAQKLVSGDFITGATNINGAINYGRNNASGNDTYAVTITGITAYKAGLMITFRPVTANTDGCTLNVNALGAVAIVDQAGSALATNRLLATSVTMVIYDGTNFVLMNP